MSDESSGAPNSGGLRLLYPATKKTRRLYLPAWLRYLISALLGACVAGLSSYALRKLGY